MPDVARREVESWMRRQLHEGEYVDKATDEVDFTGLAEGAAGHFEHDEWLYDDHHWVWNAAVNVGGQHDDERKKRSTSMFDEDDAEEDEDAD